MKKSNYLNGIIVFLIILGSLSGCEKDYYTRQREAEQNELSSYISTNYPDSLPTSSGIYFIRGGIEIIKEDTLYGIEADTLEYFIGDGEEPQTGDKVKFHYRCFFLNGMEVYTESTIGKKPKEIILGSYNYTSEIAAWHEAIYKMKVGGFIKMIVPSSQAYGYYGNGMIGSYMPLIYRIQLLEIVSDAPEI